LTALGGKARAHDREKRIPVFGIDHADAKISGTALIQLQRISL